MEREINETFMKIIRKYQHYLIKLKYREKSKTEIDFEQNSEVEVSGRVLDFTNYFIKYDFWSQSCKWFQKADTDSRNIYFFMPEKNTTIGLYLSIHYTRH